ncbi:MAG: B12-binding domain-containing radical SAM protein [Nitrospinaceae bacterium]
MKVLLLFPPDWLPSEPYLSLPALTSVLRPAGHEVVQFDANVEMYDLMFSETFLRHAAERMVFEKRHLQVVANEQGLDAEEKELWRQLAAWDGKALSALIGEVSRAKEILRSEAFYDIDQLEWATHFLHQTMACISLAYYPAQICFPPIETDLVYKPFMSTEIMEAVDDRQINVYRDVYRLLIAPLIEKEQPDVVGVSIVQQKQLISTFTFCKMIKEQKPDTHITLGGNIVTRIRDVLPEKTVLWEWVDTAVLYEGETAFLKLVNALDAGQRDLAGLPNLMWKDEAGRVQTNADVCAEDMNKLPAPDFDGLPLDKYFVPRLILPYLATRGCYWGRCTFCDHFQGYVEGYRTKQIGRITDEIRFLQNKYGNRYFHFTDESYPPALFRKLSESLIENQIDIAWTTHMRFEEQLLEEEVWNTAAEAGCRYLHFGYESGNERVLKLMDKATHLDAIRTNLRMASKAGIWNHIMGFFGFPGEEREEAEDSKRFVHANRDHIHSLGFMTFVLGKYSPVAMEPEKYGVSFYKNPEWDLALDFYFTAEQGLNIQEALDVFEEFERGHDPKWDLRTAVREYIFLYIDHFKTNNLTMLHVRPDQRPAVYNNPVGMV